MKREEIQGLMRFYQEQLRENILSFWIPRCLDEKNGGYFNCFTNDGSKLISKDKYIWSQGRFVWMWAKLSTMKGTFNAEERAVFLRYAKSGAEFLMNHSLIGPDDWRCVFLTDEFGNPKKVRDYENLDMSISADFFAALGLSRYASVTGNLSCWSFAKKLYDSIESRYESGRFFSLPYPLSSIYKAHGKPMTRTCLACEMYQDSFALEPQLTDKYMNNVQKSSREVFRDFVDSSNSLHEIRYQDGTPVGGAFGNHINPGHTIEDMWFQLDASTIGGENRLSDIAAVAKHAFKLGWDPLYGGLFHFADAQSGGMPSDETLTGKDEPQLKLVMDDWSSKLWWVHAEALYTYLRLYFETGDREFLNIYREVEEYTFSVFPNPDKSVGEWIQIRARDGSPMDKVVALPVKDPFHITRDFALIIDLLERAEKEDYND